MFSLLQRENNHKVKKETFIFLLCVCVFFPPLEPDYCICISVVLSWKQPEYTAPWFH